MSSRQKYINPTTPSKPRADVTSTLPPPINLATKPLSSHQHSAINPQQRRQGNRALVPVYVLPEHVNAVQEFVLSLGQTIFPPPDLDRDPSEELVFDDHNSSDGDVSDSVELTSVFSRMSTSSGLTPSTPAASSSGNRASAFTSGFSAPALPITSASYVPLASSQTPDTSMNKYYCILIGKKTGVFWEKWVNVEPYVKNVSGATHKSFRAYDLALAYYLDAKAKHRVRVVRDPGDDIIYGPRSQAMQ